MSKNEEWLVKVLGVPPAKAAEAVTAIRRTLRAEKLIFSRWAQVMLYFERGMYGNPEQDLGKLWYDLKAKYQLLPRPDSVSRPDYGAKYHIVGAPVYYHSYMLGDLFSCQVHDHIARELLGLNDPGKTCFVGHREVGDYLKSQIFAPGALYRWDELTERATGEPLSAKAFVRAYLGSAVR